MILLGRGSLVQAFASVAALVLGCNGASGDASPRADAASAPDAGAGASLGADATPGAPPPPPPFVPSPPVSVGSGVTYERTGAGDAVLVAYGGYSAELGHTQAWARELTRASLAARGVGHVYAAQGPKEAGYASREIGNSGLRAHLAPAIAGAAPFIFVVAHSSGSFVAHELLQQAHGAGDDATLAKIVYANLDGGESGFDETVAAKLRRTSFVYARDAALTSGLSANASTAMSLGSKYAAFGAAFEVLVPSSGCNEGAKWCLHQLVITHRPHNAGTYDLAKDYTDFANRPVTTEYIDALEAHLPP